MPSSGMLRRVALVRTDVSEELSASFIRVTRIGELGCIIHILNSEFHTSFLSHFVFLHSVCRLLVTANVVPSLPIFATLMKEALSSSETSVHSVIPQKTFVIVTTMKTSQMTVFFGPTSTYFLFHLFILGNLSTFLN
jgi:hypothetical protein